MRNWADRQGSQAVRPCQASKPKTVDRCPEGVGVLRIIDNRISRTTFQFPKLVNFALLFVSKMQKVTRFGNYNYTSKSRCSTVGPSTWAMPTDSNNTLSSSTLEPTMRKLPAVPVESRRVSRPLPKIPRALICKKCSTYISSYNVLLPLSSVSGYCTVLMQFLPYVPRFLLILAPSKDFRARLLCLQKRGFIVHDRSYLVLTFPH